METPEVWSEFRPFVKRFASTFKEFPHDSKSELILVLNRGAFGDELQSIFSGIDMLIIHYEGNGCDVGSWQYAANKIPGCFAMFCTTRTYFHRRGWMARLVECRETFGPGLYTTSGVSYEGRFHACIRCVGMDTEDFKRYPMLFDTREKGTAFEIGKDMRTGELNPDGSLSEWFTRQSLPVKCVYWNDCVDVIDEPGAVWKTVNNRYRHGDQSNMLVWDKHTDAYRGADPSEKERLSRMAYDPGE